MRCVPKSVASLSLVVAMGALASGTARAAPEAAEAATAKRFRLHAGTDVFSLIHFNPDGATNDANVNVLGFGIGRRSALDATTAGLGGVGGGVASIGFGAVLLEGRAVAGGQFAFTVDGLNVGNDGGTSIQGRFVPYFNWMFNRTGRLRPFVGAHFGLGGAAYTVVIEDDVLPGMSFRATTNVIYPNVGAQGGVHIFIVDAVSIDAMLRFDYFAPFARTRFDDPDFDNPDDDYDKVGDVISMAFAHVGVSAWF